MQDRIANEAARHEAMRRIGAGFATTGDLARHLAIWPRQIPDLLPRFGLSANPMGRFPWADIWRCLWRIGPVPPEHFATLQSAALSNEGLALRFGVCPRTIRRHGDQALLPPHLDLSPRLRRHLPLRVALWEAGEALPRWLSPARQPPGPGTGALSLHPRKERTETAFADHADKSGKSNRHPSP